MTNPLPTQLINQTSGAGVLEGIALWAHSVTKGFFWLGLLITFCGVLYISTSSRFDNARRFGFASFGGLVGAIFLFTLNLMSGLWLTVFIIAAIIGLVSMTMNEK